MKTLRNPWFIACFVSWAVIIAARKMGHPIPYLNGYTGDICCIPVIANLGLWFQRIFIIKNNYYVLSAGRVAFIVIYVSIVFEGLLPWLSKTYTADWLDVFLYILGGLFFYEVMNKPLVEVRD